MSLNHINNLLSRFIKGKCTPEEIRLVENWLAKKGTVNDEWKHMDDSSRKKWLSSLFEDVQESIEIKNKKILPINRAWKLVSAIAAMLFVTCGLYFTLPSFKNWIDTASYKQVTTALRERKDVVLADGTHVWLNSGSSLKYPDRFIGKEREVYLQGEAYFEVAHNPQSPFIVHTGELKTRVLGTVFNIRAYEKDPDVKVILFSGKVEVIKVQESNPNELGRLMLLPNQLASYKKAAGSLEKATVSNIDQYSAWKDGKFIFDETPMSEILERLSNSYGVKLSLRNKKIYGCTITGSFYASQNIEEILKSISISIGGKYTKEAGGFILHGDGCGEAKVL